MVGVEGFEPPTSCSQSRRATRLRYTPAGPFNPEGSKGRLFWERLASLSITLCKLNDQLFLQHRSPVR